MFKILHLLVEPCRSYHDQGSLRVEVRWTCESEDLSYFGGLNKYTRAQVVPDPEALEQYWKDTPPPFHDFEPVEGKPGLVRWNPKHPSPYKLGLIKNMTIQGVDHIRQVEGCEKTYEYCEYLADCYITRAGVVQIAEMKHQTENGICTYGDFPEQAGCFRSGDVLSDFAGLLRSLDLFWD